MDKIKVFYIGDQKLVGECINTYLSKIDKFEITKFSYDLDLSYDLICSTKSDVAIFNLNLIRSREADLIKKIKSNTNCKIVVILDVLDYFFIQKLFNIGIDGYLTKNSALNDLQLSIDSVYLQQKYTCPIVKNIFVNQAINPIKINKINLTDKEIDIIKLIIDGFDINQIAKHLMVSTKTIEGSKTKIYKKLKIQSNAELISYAIDKGLEF